MKFIYFLVIVILAVEQTNGQQPLNEVDSLLEEVALAPDTTKIDIYLNLAVAYRTLDIKQAYEYGLRALKLAKDKNITTLLAEAHNILGSIYRVLGEYDKAGTALHKAINLHELIANKKGVANASNSLGILYFNQKDYQNALTFYKKALELVDTTQYKSGYATFCLNIGEVYQILGELDRAVVLLNEALEIFNQSNDLEGLAYTYGVLAKIQLSEDQYTLALNSARKSIGFFEADRNDLGKVEYMLLLSDIFKAAYDLNKSRQIAQKALELAMQINTPFWMMNAHLKLASLSKRTNDYKAAYRHQDSAFRIKSEILNQEKQRQIANLRIIYETDQYIQENESLKLDQELKDKQLSQQRLIVLIISILLLLIMIFLIFAYKSNKLKKRANRLLRLQNEEIKQQREEIITQAEGLKAINKEVVLKNELIEEKNINITDSILYAKKIQSAVLPFKKRIDKGLPENFILYRPKDLVSGDFYWYGHFDDKIVVAVADCTGHGIPGAFMSFIGHDMLNYICNIKRELSPDLILNEMRANVIKLLRQKESTNRDGMDISICVIDKTKKEMQFAGANQSMLYISDNKMHQLKGDRATIGLDECRHFSEFNKHIVQLEADTVFYLFTDGYMDQFGGEQDRKFMFAPFKALIFKNHLKQLTTQKQLLEDALDKWQGHQDQVDDILIFGFRIFD